MLLSLVVPQLHEFHTFGSPVLEFLHEAGIRNLMDFSRYLENLNYLSNQ